MLPAITCSKPTIRAAVPGDQLDADLAAVQQECRTGWSEDRIIEMLGAIRDAQRGEKRALQEALAAREVAEDLLAETVERLQLTNDELKAARTARGSLEKDLAALRKVNASLTEQLANKTHALQIFTDAQRRLAVANAEPIYVDDNTRWG